MKLLQLNNISKYYGSDLILSNVNLSINSEDKVGIIGPNGCGKSTLLHIITGKEEVQEGTIFREKSINIGFVPQYHNFPENLTVTDVVLTFYHEHRRVLDVAEENLSTASEAELNRYLNEYQRVRDSYDAIEGDLLPERAEKILSLLGMDNQGDKLAANLSGGEKNRVALAKALLSNPDLLILDEPGNHLDYEALSQLESFLSSYKGALLIVSHNRYLLDRVCNRIGAFEDMTFNGYTGNYSHYKIGHLRTVTNQQAQHMASKRRLEKIEALVKKFQELATNTGDPKWGKKLGAMKSKLSREKKNAVDKPDLQDRHINVRLQSSNSKANIALQVIDYHKAFAERVLFNGANLEIKCGEKVALVGGNGTGKTTLIRHIVEHGSWDNPDIRVGPSQKIGYCSQHQETFNEQNSIEDEFLRLGPLTRDNVFSLISPFLFTWKDMGKRIGDLSGGERNRLQLARLMYLKSNFLILDEPTNHLDIRSREIIEDALLGFEGTILVVSHDRYFLDTVVDRVIEIAACSLFSHTGDFTDYWMSRRRLKNLAGRPKDSTGKKSAGKPGASVSADELEKKIYTLENEKKSLEKMILEAVSRNNTARGKELSKKLDKVNRLVDDLYTKWEVLCS